MKKSITILSGPNEKQRARKLAKRNPGTFVQVITKKGKVTYCAEVRFPYLLLECCSYKRNNHKVCNVEFIDYEI